jgi:Cu2+-exporting ATPase
MVTVMVISCPHALGLNSFGAISTAVSAQHGLLIRNKNVFAENYHNCFDKQEH